MTDGVLLAEIAHDRDLRRYDTIIIDEAHERSLNIDFLLGYLRQLLPRRPELKVIITSATIDTARFADHFARRRRPGADHRGVRADLSGRGPLPTAGRAGAEDEGGQTGVTDGRIRTSTRPVASPRRRGAGHRTGRRHPGLPLRRTGDPRRRRGDRAGSICADRGAAALRPAVGRRAAPGVRRPFRTPDRAGHQRRRDVADRARHPLRDRHRHRPDLALFGPDQGAAAADRADLAGLGQSAGRTLRPARAGHLHPALRRGGLRSAGPSSPSRRSCAPIWPR